MSHIVSGLIRKAPMIKQLQDSTMFIVELSEMVKDFKTGEKTYSNYKAMLFAKTPAAIDYYTIATAEGSFIVLHSEKLKVETFTADSGKTYITLMMDNARLEAAHFTQGQQAPAQQQYAPLQQAAPAYQQPPAQQAPQPQHQPTANNNPNQAAPQYAPSQQGFDQDVPFAPIGKQYPQLLTCS